MPMVMDTFRACLHLPSPCPSPSLCQWKRTNLTGQIGYRTHSDNHHRLNVNLTETATNTETVRVNRPLTAKWVAHPFCGLGLQSVCQKRSKVPLTKLVTVTIRVNEALKYKYTKCKGSCALITRSPLIYSHFTVYSISRL